MAPDYSSLEHVIVTGHVRQKQRNIRVTFIRFTFIIIIQSIQNVIVHFVKKFQLKVFYISIYICNWSLIYIINTIIINGYRNLGNLDFFTIWIFSMVFFFKPKGIQFMVMFISLLWQELRDKGTKIRLMRKLSVQTIETAIIKI